MIQSNKDLILALHEIWNTGNIGLIPEVYDVGFIAHWPKGWGVKDSVGHDGVNKAIMRIRSAFPDWREKIVDMIISEDRVITRYISSGTNLGDFANSTATGKKVKVNEMSIYLIRNSKVCEQWCLADDLHMSKQLGLL